MKRTSAQVRARVRLWLTLFVIGLVLSGLTAFPLETELRILSSTLGIDPAASPSDYGGLQHWIALVATALRESYAKYPFLAYGTDWLAFAHLVIAVAFIGPLRDPVRNVWVIDFGMIACLGVIPLALIAGPIRQIPFYWRLIDCSFGIFGLIPLWIVRKNIEILKTLK
jgi:succinate-acetate transporter protein